MRRIEEALVKRWSGGRIIAGSIGLGIVGVLPLLLYIQFGPADGNPIGLGLLAAATMPFAAVGMLVGLIKILVQLFTPSR